MQLFAMVVHANCRRAAQQEGGEKVGGPGGGEGHVGQEGICHGAGPVSSAIGSVQCHYDAVWQRDDAYGSVTAKAASAYPAELVVAESTSGTSCICPD